MQPQHPLQSPSRFIENVGNTVRTRLAQVVKEIGEDNLGAAWFTRCELISQQHLCGRVARCQQILELISRIMPSARCIDECSGRLRSKRSATVESVTLRFNK